MWRSRSRAGSEEREQRKRSSSREGVGAEQGVESEPKKQRLMSRSRAGSDERESRGRGGAAEKV